MSLDPNFTVPTLFQVAIPDSFLSSHKYYKPIMASMVSKFRPMDRVRVGMDEPQEDEYAIYRITDFSPIERLVFPKNSDYFLLDYPSFLPGDEKERKEWEEQLRSYFRKLHFFHGKIIVSKNPFNSMRIKELAAMFSKARFIHIVRYPFEVVPSTIHMWKIVLDQNKLNHKGSVPGIIEVTKSLDKLLTTIEKDRSVLPEENFYEMKFEDLEADPVAEFRKIYSRFHMPFDDALSHNIHSFMDNLKNYRKNEFLLADEEKEIICKQLSRHMKIFNYR